MRGLLLLTALTAFSAAPMAALAQPVSLPPAIFTDPPSDTVHPPRMEVLHIPSGGVEINGVAYLASGAGRHPTVVLLHGLPGNEKNLDLAQAIRRAGWNVVTFNYRGSWGSPGTFSFEGNLADAKAVLVYLRNSVHASTLQIDTTRLVIGGHSMGGWVSALTSAQDPGLAGTILISAADMGGEGATAATKAAVAKSMASDMEALAGTSPEKMADEVIGFSPRLSFNAQVARGLAGKPLLVLTSDDGLAPGAEKLAKAVQDAGGRSVTVRHEATDHGWSGRRIALEAAVISWLAELK
jgi:pimeloyl-ACP methyl ester carboxylesterase